MVESCAEGEELKTPESLKKGFRFRYELRKNLASKNPLLSTRATRYSKSSRSKQEDPPRVAEDHPVNVEKSKCRDGAELVIALDTPELCSQGPPPEGGVPSGPAKETSSPTVLVALDAIQPRTPVPSSGEAVFGQMPRRYPSRVRVSVASSLPNVCGKDNVSNSSKKDSSETNRALVAGSAGVVNFKVETTKFQVSSSAKKRKRVEEALNGTEPIERDEKYSSLQMPVTEGTNHSEDVVAARRKVLDALSLFETIYKKLVQGEESNLNRNGAKLDMVALKLFNQQSTVLSSGSSYVGSVPGVEVGDEFNLRVELCIVGLHRPHRNCVDFTDQGGKMVAVSLVHMRPYAKGMFSSDDFVYSSPGDLKLDGNLAFKNSLDIRTPVRVIHGFNGYRSSNSRETRARTRIVTYFYSGLYLVKKYWRKKGYDGLYACMFQMRRISGQPELVKKGIKASIGSKVCTGLIMEDISAGKEKILIPVVNIVDSEHPEPFMYITNIRYSLQHSPPSPGGFDCIGACCSLDSCGCAVEDEEIPSNNSGAIMETKSLFYQCVPSCKCPLSCHDTINEHGVNFHLEVFKTESRGWGVRSRDPIPSGSFICEYIGELIDCQVTNRGADDKYLITIRKNFCDETLWKNIDTYTQDLQKGASCKIEKRSFAIDASEYGNIGRFINHSNIPNLYVQNLLYSHDNKSMPHIVLFSAEDIPPLQELTYDYSCAINQPAKVCTTHSRLGISLSDSAGYEKVKVEAPESQVRCSTMKKKMEDKCKHGNEAFERDVKDMSLQKPVMGSSNNTEDAVAARQKVMESLSLFETIYRKLLQDGESKQKLNSEESRQPTKTDMLAFKLFHEQSTEARSGSKYVGSVPGVEVGDEFNLRVELCIVGLHRQHRLSVDFMDQRRTLVAVSIVHMRYYTDETSNCNEFVFSSSGDLKLKWNLALKNSLDTSTPIRVIHGFEGYEGSNIRATRAKKRIIAYIYGGLYLVEKYWRKKGDDGLYACMFRLKRIPQQPELVMKGVKASRSSRACYGSIIEDISEGKEKLPISVVNMIDNEHPKPFKYITKLMYPMQHTPPPPPPRGCDCVDGCSDSDSCACAVKNGGEIPFNYSGAIVEAKPLVYECGPSCKCPPSCHNRVSQRGIKFHLEVFKTESRGWGVRSRDRISSGSFICEYTGELLDDQVADRKANDEYLFDIGSNYYDETLWEGLNTKIPDLQKGASSEVEEGSFAVDASEYGNVGRFINHSCTPNIYAQNLLYDHDNKSMPRIVFFAAEDIPPLQELTYDYNYAIDQVRDSNGNIKKKICYCGTSECTGWLY